MTKSTKYSLPSIRESERFHAGIYAVAEEYRALIGRQDRVWKLTNEALARVEVLEQQVQVLRQGVVQPAPVGPVERSADV